MEIRVFKDSSISINMKTTNAFQFYLNIHEKSKWINARYTLIKYIRYLKPVEKCNDYIPGVKYFIFKVKCNNDASFI